MRWNPRERTVGELAAAAVLGVGILAASPAGYTARVRPGMTPAEVEAALGTPGRPDGWREAFHHGPRDLSDLWNPETLERERAVRREDSWQYRDYEQPSCTISVAFRGVTGDERVTAVDGYRALRPDWHLAPWLAGAVAAGLLAAEVARRVRRASPLVVPAPEPAAVAV